MSEQTPAQTIDDVMAAVAREISAVGIAKGSINKEQNFRYRSIDDVLNTVGPIIARNELTMTMTVSDRDVSESRTTKSGGILKFVTLTCAFVFRWKGQERVTTTIGEAMDTADKATNKAMAIAMKYALVSTFAIPFVGSDDPDVHGATNEVRDSQPINHAASMPNDIMVKYMADLKAANESKQVETIVQQAIAKAAEYHDRGAHDTIRKMGAAKWTVLAADEKANRPQHAEEVVQ